jgi:hypothetical protein
LCQAKTVQPASVQPAIRGFHPVAAHRKPACGQTREQPPSRSGLIAHPCETRPGFGCVTNFNDKTIRSVAGKTVALFQTLVRTKTNILSMKHYSVSTTLGILCAFGITSAQADLLYTFNTDAEGFQNVTWQAAGPLGWAGAPSIKQNHTAGGWQMMMTKEFSWEAGGGAANQQLEMQAMASQGANAHLAFDLMIDGTSFPAGASTWYSFNVVGNSDGSAGWTQKEDLFTVSGWHNADDPTLITMHIDQPFSFFGWQPGDTWFQLWTGANSDGAVPVNFYLDNVIAYATPEPSTLALVALGATLLISRRRK